MVDRAVEAMKLGAYDYLIKPFHIADMVSTLQRAAEMLSLRVRVHDTVQTAKGRYDFGRVVTQSPAMREKKYWPRRFITTVSGRKYPTRCLKASYSGTNLVRSPTRAAARKG